MTVSILMTYRETSPQRRRNLLTTLQWLAREVPDVKALVLEQDSYPRLQGGLPHGNHQAVFAYNPHRFNKSWGLNVAMRVSGASIAVFTDADLIVAGGVRALIQACGQRSPVAKPYRDVLDLSEEESERVHRGEHGFRPAPRPGRQARNEHLVLCGGMFAIRADAFYHVGGWDERFVGWGGEDDALSLKIQRANMQVAALDGVALHLWHPRAVEQMERRHYLENVALLESLRANSDVQLHRMAEVQRQVIGHREKYRPMEGAQ